MLNETASSTDDRPLARASVRYDAEQHNPQHDTLRQLVGTVLVITREEFEPFTARQNGDRTQQLDPMMFGQNHRLLARFEGKLIEEPDAAYDALDTLLTPTNQLALFREEKGAHVIYVISGRITPQPRSWWLNAVLFIATLGSVLLLGTEMAISEIAADNAILARQLIENLPFELWRGLPYAISILLILGAHELGHYFAARYHKLAVTLPYFIPAPFISPIGTFGAFIQLRQPMKNRKVLLDVGAAGPLAGLIFAIPIVLIGLATSQVREVTGAGLVEGNSFLYALSKTLVFGRFLPSGGEDVFVNQLAWAGWTGLLVTGLNLIPLGQLDGGHILYSLIGDRARRLYYPLLIAMLFMVLFVSQSWLLWMILLFLFGRVYAAPLDMITPLDERRKRIGWLALFVFIVTFVPIPFSVTEIASIAPPTPQPPGSTVLLPLALGLVMLWTRRTR